VVDQTTSAKLSHCCGLACTEGIPHMILGGMSDRPGWNGMPTGRESFGGVVSLLLN